MTTIKIGTMTVGDAGLLLDLQAGSLKRWGAVGEKRHAPRQASAERASAETIIAAYRAFAIDRLMEVVHLRVRRNALPRWRWLADRLLAHRQETALAHARRHLANIETAERVALLLPTPAPVCKWCPAAVTPDDLGVCSACEAANIAHSWPHPDA